MTILLYKNQYSLSLFIYDHNYSCKQYDHLFNGTILEDNVGYGDGDYNCTYIGNRFIYWNELIKIE